jgi:signal transduction histidine kinase
LQETQEVNEKLDMTTAFAMVSHDIKNSLGVLLEDLNNIIGRCDFSSCVMRSNCADMEYEVRRINNNLVKMLTLFKVEAGDYLLNLDAHSVHDFLEEMLLEQSMLMGQKGIGYEVECDTELYWYFDRNLMTGVMGNAISNALRYTQDKLLISAAASDHGLVISVEDNGKGFPAFMLDQQAEFLRPESGFLNNNTGLGLYFTQQVLELHQHDGLQGRVALANDGVLKGGQLTIVLP